jgi:hypothetical protein
MHLAMLSGMHMTFCVFQPYPEHATSMMALVGVFLPVTFNQKLDIPGNVPGSSIIIVAEEAIWIYVYCTLGCT